MMELSKVKTHCGKCNKAVTFDLISHLVRQHEFSINTFGPGKRVDSLLDHISKEIIEVHESAGALSEWIDIVILALEGALRSVDSALEVALALEAKQRVNEGRRWPDWRSAQDNKAIEHIR